MAEHNLDASRASMAGAQADIAQLMYQIMRRRDALTGPYQAESGGPLTGPMVDALMQAMQNMQQTQDTPRLRLRARPFNPYSSRLGPTNLDQRGSWMGEFDPSTYGDPGTMTEQGTPMNAFQAFGPSSPQRDPQQIPMGP